MLRNVCLPSPFIVIVISVFDNKLLELYKMIFPSDKGKFVRINNNGRIYWLNVIILLFFISFFSILYFLAISFFIIHKRENILLKFNYYY